MPWILVPVLLVLGLMSHDDVHRFWWDHPHQGCHFLYHERMLAGGTLAWPLVRSNQVLCWQEGRVIE